MVLTTAERNLISPSGLYAVFDESGHRSSEPGIGDDHDFAIASVVFQGRNAFKNLKQLDLDLQQITGRNDYKYRQVRQSTEARSRVFHCLDHQSGLIRVYGFYAAGGAFLREAERALSAVTAMNGSEESIQQAKKLLSEMQANPGREGLRDSIVNSVPGIAFWAKNRNKIVHMYFDQRSDMQEFSGYLFDYIDAFQNAREWAQFHNNLIWHAECVEILEPVARIADIFAGDFRHTIRKHGDNIWPFVKEHGFVNRPNECREIVEGQMVFGMPQVGAVHNDVWDSDFELASTSTTMFAGYKQHLLNRRFSLFSPHGIGIHLSANNDQFVINQNPD